MNIIFTKYRIKSGSFTFNFSRFLLGIDTGRVHSFQCCFFKIVRVVGPYSSLKYCMMRLWECFIKFGFVWMFVLVFNG